MKKKTTYIFNLFAMLALAFFFAIAVGGKDVKAANPLIQTKTATKANPISKLVYTPLGDGTFDVTVTVDMNVYAAGELTGVQCSGMISYSKDDSACIASTIHGGDPVTSGIHEYKLCYFARKVKANENFWIKFVYYTDTQGDDLLSTISWQSADFTAPADVMTGTGTFSERTGDFTSSKGKEVYTKMFSADSSKIFLASCDYVTDSGYSWDTSAEIKVTDSSGNTITREFASSDSGYKYQWKFTKADTYTFSVICRNSGKCAYNVKGALQAAPAAAAEAFVGFNVNLIKSSDGSFGYAVEYKDYTGADSSYALFYREDNVTGKLTCCQSATSYQRVSGTDTPPILDRKYTYYVVKEKTLKEKVPELKDYMSIGPTYDLAKNSDVRKKLQSVSSYKTVTTPPPVVSTVSVSRIATDVKKADLALSVSGTAYTKVTGYQVYQYYNGKYKKSFLLSRTYNNSVTIPYAGTSGFRVRGYYKYNGKTYYSAWSAMKTCTSQKIKAPSAVVTKISSKKASITITNKSNGVNGTIIYQQVGGKWKKLKTLTGTKYVTTKNTAGKRKYRFVAYTKDAGKTYYSSASKAVAPKSNIFTCKYSNYVSGYAKYNHFWRPDKFYYSKGKIKVKGKFINTHIYGIRNWKIRLTLKVDGKTVGYQTINCGTMKASSIKKVTFTLKKSKKDVDLRGGRVYWSYDTISGPY